MSVTLDPPSSSAPDRGRAGTRLVLSPQEPLVEGGAAEEFERSVQLRLAEGYRHLVVDLAGVPRLDDAGIRALVRGHTTARRRGGSFRVARANDQVRAYLRDARLDGVFPVLESIEEAQAQPWPWRTIALGAAGAAFCAGLLAIGTFWLPPESVVPTGLDFGTDSAALPPGQPFLALLKLVVAAGIGLLITIVHRPLSGDKPHSRSMQQAQMLLCVAGAMVMIIIGNSVARAFGVAGAASIIRFRTPVEDPRDITILFLLMGLGMATGLGAFAVAGLGTAFLCLLLFGLDRLPSDQKPRELMVELVADGREFPTVHVESVFARNGILFEPRDVSQGKEATVKYHVALDRRLPLEEVSAQLAAAPALKSVAWKKPKKGAV